MEIRPATRVDCAEIAALWEPVIRDSEITFNSAVKTEAEIAGMLAERRAAGHAFLVARQDGRLMGFATYAPLRPGTGSARTMEHTIILNPAAQGRGLGRLMMAALEDHARAAGVHALWAAISPANPSAVGFHAALGFTHVATLPEIGWKFGRWYDLILMRKTL
ncbi:GNAT family N-acetyltransferase [Maritimibacter sp. 55A14]|uniref:GNAT family N-acetyltransferase n=1 Tax=Maritimibacter sp. 55A14 TaxID=2174844 RepID=UPI000D60E647|nr:GNAT family N-acetyltransferase [Maritimibacter sp. 55A14]PWE33857.1 GNAT family N-acetyltransferase [Maritimibacter sp. 55A14]